MTTTFQLEFKNDGSWWTWKRDLPLDEAFKLIPKARKQGNGNEARIVMTTELQTVVHSTEKREKK